MTGDLDTLRASLEAALDATRRIDAFAADLRATGFPVRIIHDGALPVVVVNITVGEHTGTLQDAAPASNAFALKVVVPPPEPDQRRAETGAPVRKIGPWSDLELAELARLHASGATVSEISAALGRAPQAVGSHVRRLEDQARADENVAPPPPKPAPSPPLPARDMSDGWTALDDLSLVEGLSRGRKLPGIAHELRRPIDECKARFRKLLPHPTMEGQTKLIRTLKAEVLS